MLALWTRSSSGDEILKVTSLCFTIVSFTSWRHVHRVVTILVLMPTTEGFSWADLGKNLHGGQRMAKVKNDEEMLPKVSTHWIGRTNVTDNRRICDSQYPNVAWSCSGNKMMFYVCSEANFSQLWITFSWFNGYLLHIPILKYRLTVWRFSCGSRVYVYLCCLVWWDNWPLQRQLFQIFAVWRVQRHTGLTHHF